ncbi:MAG: class I SAM-dependent methyltransferase [Limisphaerales bacterium]
MSRRHRLCAEQSAGNIAPAATTVNFATAIMDNVPTASEPANYGIDAPKVVMRMFLAGIMGVVLGGVSWLASHWHWLPWAGYVVSPALWLGGIFLGQCGVMLWGSKVGKLRLRDRILKTIPWRGDERVLDVGCGHGLMLLGAAKRLTSGRATGIDIWSQEDQKSNSAAATMENARREGVNDRVELLNADARAIPFPSGSFDVVISSFAIHNIYDRAQRDQAIREIARVLKPGGRLAITDLRHVAEYEQVLRQFGWSDIQCHGPYFLFFIPTRMLRAIKP